MNITTQSEHRLSPLLLISLIVLIVLGVLLRLIDLNDPPLDFHTSRQLRNSIVARDIYYQLSPNADPQKAKLAASFANSVGHYEPAIIESIVALTDRIVWNESYAVPRIWQTLFWILAGLALFDLARTRHFTVGRIGSLSLLSGFAVFGSGEPFLPARPPDDSRFCSRYLFSLSLV